MSFTTVTTREETCQMVRQPYDFAAIQDRDPAPRERFRPGASAQANKIWDAIKTIPDGSSYFTAKSLLPAAVPFSDTATAYLPAGQPSGFTMWNSVRDLRVGAIVSDSSFTTCPSW